MKKKSYVSKTLDQLNRESEIKSLFKFIKRMCNVKDEENKAIDNLEYKSIFNNEDQKG